MADNENTAFHNSSDTAPVMPAPANNEEPPITKQEPNIRMGATDVPVTSLQAGPPMAIAAATTATAFNGNLGLPPSHPKTEPIAVQNNGVLPSLHPKPNQEVLGQAASSSVPAPNAQPVSTTLMSVNYRYPNANAHDYYNTGSNTGNGNNVPHPSQEFGDSHSTRNNEHPSVAASLLSIHQNCSPTPIDSVQPPFYPQQLPPTGSLSNSNAGLAPPQSFAASNNSEFGYSNGDQNNLNNDDASSGLSPLFTLNPATGAAGASATVPTNPISSNDTPHLHATLHELNSNADTVEVAAGNEGNHNTNFWLQEEEERFLLGLRLYGWGQWKRIQTIVKTRSNKQIKSHAQKREKVNPDIKFKYGKGKSRRGRISSKVLAADARGMAAAAATAAVTNGTSVAATAVPSADPSIPSLDIVWKDVYGTNNGNGPNSRLRRYRNSVLHQQWLEQMQTTPSSQQQQQQQQQYQQEGPQTQPPPYPTTDAQQSTQSHHPGQQLQQPIQHPPPSTHPKPTTFHTAVNNVKDSSQAMPSLPASNGRGRMPRSYYEVKPPQYSTSSSTNLPPLVVPPPIAGTDAAAPAFVGVGVGITHIPTNHASGDLSTTSPMVQATLSPLPGATTTPIANNNPPTNNTIVPPKETFYEALRPGMRVYARYLKGPNWYPGVIYSAKVDPNRISALNMTNDSKDSAMAALLYHIQYDNRSDDPSVQEELVLSKAGYEAAILDLERHYSLSHLDNKRKTRPLEGGTPVYAQWMDKSNPRSHAKWLPGTVHSSQKVGHDGYAYHILFDNDDERDDVSEECVLDRTEYQELVVLKNKCVANENQLVGSLKSNWQESMEGEAKIDTNNPFLKPIGDISVKASAKTSYTSINDQSAANGCDDSQPDGSQPGALDLLFTASQMAAPISVSSKKLSPKTSKRSSSTAGSDLNQQQTKKNKPNAYV